MTKSISSHPVRSRFFYGYVIVIAAFFILLSAYGVRFAYGVFFTPMANELGWSSATTSAAWSISMLLEGVFSFIMGGLTDRLGPRKVLTISALVVGLGYGLIQFVHSVWQLYLFYGVILGIGMGAMFVPVVSIVARWFTARRSLVTGIVSSGTGIGMIVVSPLATQLISIHGWRWTYLIMGMAVMVIVLIAAQFLRRDPAQMGLTPYGEKPTATRMPIRGFSFTEALRYRQLWFIILMVICFGFFSTSINVHIVPDAIHQGMSNTTAAYILAVTGALLIVGRISLGITADKIGNKAIFILGFILSAAALFWISAYHANWAFFLFAAILGFSQGGLGTSQSPFVASLFGLKSHGMIYGFSGFGYTVGAAVGPFVTGLIFDATGSYNIALIVCAITCIIALGITLLVQPIKGTQPFATRI